MSEDDCFGEKSSVCSKNLAIKEDATSFGPAVLLSLLEVRQIAWTCTSCSFANELQFYQRDLKAKEEPTTGAVPTGDDFPACLAPLECRQCGSLAAHWFSPRGVFTTGTPSNQLDDNGALCAHSKLASLQLKAQIQREHIEKLTEQLRSLEAAVEQAEVASLKPVVPDTCYYMPSSSRRSSWHQRLASSFANLARPSRRHSASGACNSSARGHIDHLEIWRSGVRAQMAAEAEAARQRRASETPEQRHERVRQQRDKLLRRRLKEAEDEVEERRRRDAEASANSPPLPRHLLLQSNAEGPWSCRQLQSALPAADYETRRSSALRSWNLSEAALGLEAWSRGGGRGGSSDVWSGAFAPVINICGGRCGYRK